jgi:hypothetical protein
MNLLWGRRDLNPHGLRHMILSHARLPIPTRPRKGAVILPEVRGFGKVGVNASSLPDQKLGILIIVHVFPLSIVRWVETWHELPLGLQFDKSRT